MKAEGIFHVDLLQLKQSEWSLARLDSPQWKGVEDSHVFSTHADAAGVMISDLSIGEAGRSGQRLTAPKNNGEEYK